MSSREKKQNIIHCRVGLRELPSKCLQTDMGDPQESILTRNEGKRLHYTSPSVKAKPYRFIPNKGRRILRKSDSKV